MKSPKIAIERLCPQGINIQCFCQVLPSYWLNISNAINVIHWIRLLSSLHVLTSQNIKDSKSLNWKSDLVSVFYSFNLLLSAKLPTINHRRTTLSPQLFYYSITDGVLYTSHQPLWESASTQQQRLTASLQSSRGKLHCLSCFASLLQKFIIS